MIPKILAWDLETSYIIGMFFQLFEQRISHENILQDSFVICGAWQWIGKKKIYSVSVLDDPKRFKRDYTDDYFVIKTLHDVLSEADAIVAHNGKKFDFRVFNARCLYHGLPPIKPVIQIDTLQIARKHFRLTSNRLDHIGQVLGVGGKLHTPKGLWKDCTLGDPKAIKKMVKYNRRDVPLLTDVYHKLFPFFETIINHNIFLGTECNCPKCGNDRIQSRGTKKTKTREYRQFQCQECMSWFSKTEKGIAR